MDNDAAFTLLRSMAEGNEGALKEIYRAFSKVVYAFALNRLKDHGKAEEIVVDTMYEVWKHPDRFRGESSFKTWLLGIARYKVLTAYRNRSTAYDEIDEALPSLEPGAYELLAEKEHREGVRRCMDKLPDEQRDCLHFVFYEGLSLSEIAELQQCPENTVKTRLFHARQKIKCCLGKLREATSHDD
jgi:RNA polymerase sigma-70 factor (ECF subfamily)